MHRLPTDICTGINCDEVWVGCCVVIASTETSLEGVLRGRARHHCSHLVLLNLLLILIFICSVIFLLLLLLLRVEDYIFILILHLHLRLRLLELL